MTTTHYTERRILFGQDYDLVPGEMLVLCNESSEPQAVNFLCPCGCGSGGYTRLVTKDRPRRPDDQANGIHLWEYSPGPTLHPSIRYTGGCKSHFNIEAVNGVPGSVKWHEDSGK